MAAAAALYLDTSVALRATLEQGTTPEIEQPRFTRAPGRPTAPDCSRRIDCRCYEHGLMEELSGDDMSTSVLDVPLPDATRERLKEIATRSRRTEAEIAATLIEGGARRGRARAPDHPRPPRAGRRRRAVRPA
jgi:hypothetical protein